MGILLSGRWVWLTMYHCICVNIFHDKIIFRGEWLHSFQGGYTKCQRTFCAWHKINKFWDPLHKKTLFQRQVWLLCSFMFHSFQKFPSKPSFLQLSSWNYNWTVPNKQYYSLSSKMMLSFFSLYCYHLGSFAFALYAASWIFHLLWFLGINSCSLLLLLGGGCSCCILFGESTLIVSKYFNDENNTINIFHYFHRDKI